MGNWSVINWCKSRWLKMKYVILFMTMRFSFLHSSHHFSVQSNRPFITFSIFFVFAIVFISIFFSSFFATQFRYARFCATSDEKVIILLWLDQTPECAYETFNTWHISDFDIRWWQTALIFNSLIRQLKFAYYYLLTGIDCECVIRFCRDGHKDGSIETCL